MNKVIFLLQAIMLVVNIISSILTRIQKKQNNRQKSKMTVVLVIVK